MRVNSRVFTVAEHTEQQNSDLFFRGTADRRDCPLDGVARGVRVIPRLQAHRLAQQPCDKSEWRVRVERDTSAHELTDLRPQASSELSYEARLADASIADNM